MPLKLYAPGNILLIGILVSQGLSEIATGHGAHQSGHLLWAHITSCLNVETTGIARDTRIVRWAMSSVGLRIWIHVLFEEVYNCCCELEE